MDIDHERLTEKLRRGQYLLGPDIEPVGVQVSVVDGDFPFVGSEIRRLRLAVSPQTGGCESDRDSPLREGLSRDEQDADGSGDDRQRAMHLLEWKPHGTLPW
jgi:hypothetical protein